MHCEAGGELRNVVCSRSILVALLVVGARLLWLFSGVNVFKVYGSLYLDDVT